MRAGPSREPGGRRPPLPLPPAGSPLPIESWRSRLDLGPPSLIAYPTNQIREAQYPVLDEAQGPHVQLSLTRFRGGNQTRHTYRGGPFRTTPRSLYAPLEERPRHGPVGSR